MAKRTRSSAGPGGFYKMYLKVAKWWFGHYCWERGEGDLISSMSTAGSDYTPKNKTSHIYPWLVFLPLFTQDGHETRRPTTADHDQQIYFRFHCVSVRTSHSWKHAENSIRDAIKTCTLFFTITSLEKGRHCSADSLRQHRGYWMCVGNSNHHNNMLIKQM